MGSPLTRTAFSSVYGRRMRRSSTACATLCRSAGSPLTSPRWSGCTRSSPRVCSRTDGCGGFNVVYTDALEISRTTKLEDAVAAFERDVSLMVGERARTRVLVHAGVVAVDGRAVVLPVGRSPASRLWWRSWSAQAPPTIRTSSR